MRATAVRLIERAEDSIYLVVSVFLIGAALFLMVGVVTGVVSDLQAQAANGAYDPLALVIDVLDKGLVLFMVAELLHTVRITVHERGLAAEPFLIVGLIAAIRRVLIVTAQAEKNFSWGNQGVQLVVLASLIVVMAGAIFIWRWSESRSRKPAA